MRATLCLCLFSLLLSLPLHSKKKLKYEYRTEHSDNLIKSLYHSLERTSVSQHLAFYELYPETEEGIQALQHAWKLLSNGSVETEQITIALPKFDIQTIISLISRQSFDPPVTLTENQLGLIEKIGSQLHNRSLKGHQVWTKEEVLQLNSEEIDLARGLLIFQFDESKNIKEEIRQYEASIDLMALQIAARLTKTASSEEKIREINRFIFQEMQFRFPPHSLYASDIDLYTFLPSVLDSRQGVCLGVSILYLSLAQRLNLNLEIITPPGHIYVRYKDTEKVINIETTARGIDVPSDAYLGINTKKLQKRTMKEVIGLAFMNQASVFWSKQDYKKVVQLYEKAALFLPDDSLLKMFMGFNYLFVGENTKANHLLRQIRHLTLEDAVSQETIPDDYLSGKINSEGIKAVFLPVDETRDSIKAKQAELKKILKRYPHFRAGLLQLATTWLQLGRQNEARDVLENYQKIDQTHCIVEYYLAALCMERLDYNRAWNYFNQAEKIVSTSAHHPKALSSLKEQLTRLCPEPK